MSINRFFVRTVTVNHPGVSVDRYGNTVEDWSTATTTETRGWLAQTSGNEDHDRRDAAVSSWSLFLPPDVTLAIQDRLTIDAITYELDGPPNDAWTPRGLHHKEATLRLVDG